MTKKYVVLVIGLMLGLYAPVQPMQSAACGVGNNEVLRQTADLFIEIERVGPVNVTNRVCRTIFEALPKGDHPSPLHEAVKDKNIPAVLMLLRGGAEIDATDGVGNTPLHYAVVCGAGQIMRLLFDYGASTGLKNNDGLDAIVIAWVFVDYFSKLFPIVYQLNNIEQRVLTLSGGDVDVTREAYELGSELGRIRTMMYDLLG